MPHTAGKPADDTEDHNCLSHEEQSQKKHLQRGPFGTRRNKLGKKSKKEESHLGVYDIHYESPPEQGPEAAAIGHTLGKQDLLFLEGLPGQEEKVAGTGEFQDLEGSGRGIEECGNAERSSRSMDADATCTFPVP